MPGIIIWQKRHWHYDLDISSYTVRSFCGIDLDPCQVRHQKNRLGSCNGNQNHCRSDFFVDHGARCRLTTYNNGNRAQGIYFLDSFGTCYGCVLDCYFKALSARDINKVVPIDKSSTVLTVLLAIICFGETSNLVMKLIATAILAVGIFLMVEKKKREEKQERKMWMLYAVLAAVFAALTSILAKIGISGVESNLGTAIRTGVVLIMAWVIVYAKGKQTQIKSIDKKELLFIGLSGIATGASWLCYYYAIQNGEVSVVVPIDKLSIIVTVISSYFVFKEKLSKKAFAGLCLMVVGTLLMVFFK